MTIHTEGPAVASRGTREMLWVCPGCGGKLARGSESLDCVGCAEAYTLVAGIPDFRRLGRSRAELDLERERAEALASRAAQVSAEELIHGVFAARSTFTAADARSRTRAVLDGIPRLSREAAGWLEPCVPPDGPILDLGCGAGQLMAALGGSGRRIVGVDVSLELLVLAAALLRERGVAAELAAGEAEALPLSDASIASVISLDVIEHVADPAPYLREIDRVLADDGTLAITTPNRFSLAAEPHVSVWGVGWLPRRWQKAYAEWRRGKPYENVRLLSHRELRRLVRAETSLEATVLIPEVPPEELSRFPPRRRILGRIYNWLVRWTIVRTVLRPFVPFYRVFAVRREREG